MNNLDLSIHCLLVTWQVFYSQLKNHLKLKYTPWSIYATALCYLSTKKNFTAWVDYVIIDEPPLYQNFFHASTWLRDTLPNAEWKTGILRQFVNLLNKEKLPLGLRARFLIPFVMLNDTSSPLLFKQLLKASSPSTQAARRYWAWSYSIHQGNRRSTGIV